MRNIVLFGPPGAGKGTQSQKIIEKYNLVHISTGDILRKEIALGSELGIEAKRLIDDGNYVTDEMAIEIIKAELNRNKSCNGFIFDGFPRTKHQAEIFPGLLKDFGGDVNVMISLDVKEKILISRLAERAKQSGRPDDRKEEIIKKRIGIYNDRTAVVSNYYKNLGKHQLINGDGKIDVIFEEICETIEKYT
jgi:adenylate kinase